MYIMLSSSSSPSSPRTTTTRRRTTQGRRRGTQQHKINDCTNNDGGFFRRRKYNVLPSSCCLSLLLSSVVVVVVLGLQSSSSNPRSITFANAQPQTIVVEDVIVQCMRNKLTAEELTKAIKTEGSDRFLGTTKVKGNNGNGNGQGNSNRDEDDNVDDDDDDDFDEEDASVSWTLATGYEWEVLANKTFDSDDLDGIVDNVTDTTSTGAVQQQQGGGGWKQEVLLSPFLFCSRTYNTSGYERFTELREMILSVDPTVIDYLNDPQRTEILFNKDDLSCAITRIPARVAASCCFTQVAQRNHTLDNTKPDIVIQPFVSLMKLTSGSLQRLERAFDDDSRGNNNGNGSGSSNSNANGNNSMNGNNNGNGNKGNGNNGNGNGNGNKQNENDTTTISTSSNQKTTTQQGSSNKKQWKQKKANSKKLIPNLQVIFCKGAIDFTIDSDGNEILEDDIAVQKGLELQQALLERNQDGTNEAAQRVLGSFFNLVNDKGDKTKYKDKYLPEQAQKDKYQTKLKKKKQFWDQIYQSESNEEIRLVCDRIIKASTVTANAKAHTALIETPRDYKIVNNETGEVIEEGNFDTDGSGWEIQKFCTLSIVTTITASDAVCGLDVQEEVNVTNTISAFLQQTGIQGSTPWYDVGLNGQNQIISISDTGLDTNLCYFQNSNGQNSVLKTGRVDLNQRKVVQYVPFVDTTDAPSGHGTHVCGTAVASRVDGQPGMVTGIANGAKLAFFDIGHSDQSLSVPVPVDQIFARTASAGSHFHSASWGSESNAYGFNSRGFDRYIFDNDNYLVMVAAGNSGGGSNFRSVGDPATAKNIIAVGASNSADQDLILGQLGPSYVADFSSRGPTFDGRTKPDIIAPGKFILSTNSGGKCDPTFRPSAGSSADGVLSLAGTSMATPGVTGSAAIIRQYFTEGWYPDGVKNQTNIMENPSAALLKAVLLNGGRRMDGVDNGRAGVENSQPYDQIQNYGHVSFVDSIYLPTVSNVKLIVWDREEVRQGRRNEYTVTVDTSGGCTAKQLSVTLVWTDIPAQAGCRNCLINDLDLTVVREGGSTTYFPNGLDTNDRTNNVERVRVDSNNGDVFRLVVEGNNLVFGSQTYALVTTGCFGNSASSLDFSSSQFVDPSSAGLTTKWKIIIGVVAGVVGIGIVAGAIIWARQRRGAK